MELYVTLKLPVVEKKQRLYKDNLILFSISFSIEHFIRELTKYSLEKCYENPTKIQANCITSYTN